MLRRPAVSSARWLALLLLLSGCTLTGPNARVVPSHTFWWEYEPFQVGYWDYFTPRSSDRSFPVVERMELDMGLLPLRSGGAASWREPDPSRMYAPICTPACPESGPAPAWPGRLGMPSTDG